MSSSKGRGQLLIDFFFRAVQHQQCHVYKPILSNIPLKANLIYTSLTQNLPKSWLLTSCIAQRNNQQFNSVSVSIVAGTRGRNKECVVKWQFIITFAWTFSNSVTTLYHCVQQFALTLQESNTMQLLSIV